MVNDIEIIKKIEEKLKPQLDEPLKLLDIEDINKFFNFFVRGYAFNHEKQVVGLRLEKLDIHFSLIDDIRELKQIQKINFRFSQVEEASFLKELKGMTHLDLRYCNLKDISFIEKLSELTHLDLSGNKLRDVSYLKDLKSLSFLDLSDNDLNDVSLLKDLESLTHLNLSNNARISDYSFLKDLDRLRSLHLILNELKDVSFLKDLDNLESVALDKNPIENLPPEIIKQGLQSIKNYMRSFEKSSEKNLNEVKIIFLGAPGSGKTSLMKRLLGEGFDLNESPTHGIDIKHWKVKSGGKEIRLNFWDFGGQEIMHSTHQFFMSKRGLYILVLDGRKEEDPEYWLKYIESFGGDSPVMVTLNKIDHNPSFEINRKFLMEKYTNIKGFFRISCCTAEGIDNVISALEKNVGHIHHINTVWPNKWFNVKDYLEEMKEDFISYDKYEEICLKENITDNETQHSLVGLLHDLGVIMHFEDPSLKEMNIINPEWATSAVYDIITSRVLSNQKGILYNSQLNEILDKDRFPKRRHDFIIELMKKFELCFSLGEDKILIPDLLAVEEPEFEFNYQSAFKFLIQYDFLPKSIIPRFIVRMYKEIKDNLRWRTGVVLQDLLFDCTAVVKADEKEKKIMVFVLGNQTRDYFSFIRRTLQKINNLFSKINASEMVSCPCQQCVSIKQPHFYGYDSLIKALHKGIKQVQCQESFEDVPVEDLLSGIVIENKKDSYTSGNRDVFISYSSKDIAIIENICKDLEKYGISYWLDEKQLNAGDNIIREIGNYIEKSRFFMPCYSKNQLESGWCNGEVDTAIYNNLSRSERKIIPLILNDLSTEKLPPLIKPIKCARHSDKVSYDNLLSRLINEKKKSH